MRRTIIASCLAFGFAVAVTGCASQQSLDAPTTPSAEPKAAPVDAIRALRASFRSHYNAAIEHHGVVLRNQVPIITQDLLNMTLLRSDGSTERFRMDSKMYWLMANISHPPLTIYSILSVGGYGELSFDQRDKLDGYRATVSAAEQQIARMSIDPRMQGRLVRILGQSRDFLDSALARGSVSRTQYSTYATGVLPLIQENLSVGASEQIRQFNDQLAHWKQQYPQEDWDNLRVVIMGFHQARDNYALSQFFEWLLREPVFERRVSFAEFQHPIFGPQNERATAEKLALLQLVKIDFELDASKIIFGYERFLQHDVMGPAATRVIEQLGDSPW